MTDDRRTYVHDAELVLGEDVDPRAPGGAVTVELCGHWDHPGPCRWPHNSEISLEQRRAHFRTVFVASAADEGPVRERIERGLRSTGDWRVLSCGPRAPTPAERELGAKLGAG